MKILDELKYSKTHEWIKVEGSKVYFGITDYAQNQLGEIVSADFPNEGKRIKKEEVIAVLESVRAVVDIFSPMSGTVVEVNTKLLDNLENINKEPYESWFVALEISDKSELDNLLNALDYKKYACIE